MRICVLSGKGGAGKTFVSVNLAYSLDRAAYIDCDIEEPNGAIFLKPHIKQQEEVKVKVPQVVEGRCIGCKRCVTFCQFNALAFIKNSVMIFPELCHNCGGCMKVCSKGALEEVDRSIGVTEKGLAGNVQFAHGIVNEGEPTGVPIIKTLLKDVSQHDTTIIDCPPGSACTVMESIDGCDFCILVTEPTPFGVHNLQMVYELTREFSIPCGVVINKAAKNNEIVYRFCHEQHIPILMEIPYDRELATLSSNGYVVSEQIPQYKKKFISLYQAVQEVVVHEATRSLER